jgi:glycerol-3-phosphate dehydrogenase (NAD(P)+)
VDLPPSIRVTCNLAEAVQAPIVLVVVPSKVIREVAAAIARVVSDWDTVFVSCTKGIEHETGNLMTDILEQELAREKPVAAKSHVAVLSGPNLAVEVAAGAPAAAVLGCADADVLERVQHALNLPVFRIYRSGDVAGIQLGGALKNVFAIAAGCADGFGLGNNAKAALVTRSLAEMTRLGVALGGQRETFSGLSGIGDLMVTCFGPQSRNRSFGERLGKGEKPDAILASMTMVVEGVPTTRSAWQQARRLGVETPIIDGVYAVLYENADPRRTMVDLLGRSLKPEIGVSLP